MAITRAFIKDNILKYDTRPAAGIVKVLGHIAGPLCDGSLIKEVADNKHYIKTVFTKASLDNFVEGYTDSFDCPPGWDHALLLLNQHRLHFQSATDLINKEGHSQFILLVDQFSLVDLHEGFYSKHDVVNIMSDKEIKEKALELEQRQILEVHATANQRMDSENQSLTLTQLLEEMGQHSLPSHSSPKSQDHNDDAIHSDQVNACHFMSLEEACQAVHVINVEDFVISQEQQAILNSIKEWKMDFVLPCDNNGASENEQLATINSTFNSNSADVSNKNHSDFVKDGATLKSALYSLAKNGLHEREGGMCLGCAEQDEGNKEEKTCDTNLSQHVQDKILLPQHPDVSFTCSSPDDLETTTNIYIASPVVFNENNKMSNILHQGSFTGSLRAPGCNSEDDLSSDLSQLQASLGFQPSVLPLECLLPVEEDSQQIRTNTASQQKRESVSIAGNTYPCKKQQPLLHAVLECTPIQEFVYNKSLTTELHHPLLLHSDREEEERMRLLSLEGANVADKISKDQSQVFSDNSFLPFMPIASVDRSQVSICKDKRNDLGSCRDSMSDLCISPESDSSYVAKETPSKQQNSGINLIDSDIIFISDTSQENSLSVSRSSADTCTAESDNHTHEGVLMSEVIHVTPGKTKSYTNGSSLTKKTSIESESEHIEGACHLPSLTVEKADRASLRSVNALVNQNTDHVLLQDQNLTKDLSKKKKINISDQHFEISSDEVAKDKLPLANSGQLQNVKLLSGSKRTRDDLSNEVNINIDCLSDSSLSEEETAVNKRLKTNTYNSVHTSVTRKQSTSSHSVKKYVRSSSTILESVHNSESLTINVTAHDSSKRQTPETVSGNKRKTTTVSTDAGLLCWRENEIVGENIAISNIFEMLTKNEAQVKPKEVNGKTQSPPPTIGRQLNTESACQLSVTENQSNSTEPSQETLLVLQPTSETKLSTTKNSSEALKKNKMQNSHKQLAVNKKTKFAQKDKCPPIKHSGVSLQSGSSYKESISASKSSTFADHSCVRNVPQGQRRDEAVMVCRLTEMTDVSEPQKLDQQVPLHNQRVPKKKKSRTPQKTALSQSQKSKADLNIRPVESLHSSSKTANTDHSNRIESAVVHSEVVGRKEPSEADAHPIKADVHPLISEPGNDCRCQLAGSKLGLCVRKHSGTGKSMAIGTQTFKIEAFRLTVEMLRKVEAVYKKSFR